MKMSQQYPSQKLSMKNTSQVYRNDLDKNDRMKKLIAEDQSIIKKFEDGKYTTDNGYLNQIKANSDYKPVSKQTYTPNE